MSEPSTVDKIPEQPKKLSKKHSEFLDEYLRTFSGWRSYKKIYPRSSERSARANAARLLATDNFTAEYERRLNELHMGKDELLKLLADEARGDVGMFMDVTTTGWNIDLLQRDTNGELIHDASGNVIRKPETKLIKKLKQKVTTIIGKAEDGEDREIIETEIELYDAQAAKVHLGKHLKLFTEQVDITSGGKRIVVDMLDDTDE
jgi:phage terminase small subunit